MTFIPPFLSLEKARFLPIPEELQSAFHPAKLCLFEWTDYWFQWPGATHLLVGGQRIEPFALGLFRVRFENALGATSIEPWKEGVPFDAPFFVEVISPKFPTPQSHFDFFSALLHDLFERAAPLPFAWEGPTRRGVDTSSEEPSPYWTRLFLAQNAKTLSGLLRQFLAQPNPQWERESVWMEAGGTSRFDADSLLQTVRDSSVWRRERGQLRPARMMQNRSYERLDTPENRFVAAFSRRLVIAIDALDEGEWRELRSICALVGAQFPQWDDVVTESSALQRRAVTRDLLRLWQLWAGAGAPLFQLFERAARLRDIASLFEFWTFFVLCDEIGAALGEKPRLKVLADEPRGLKPLSKAYFSSGTLVYNGAAPSYSTPLRPDFLWLENGDVTLAFDAKFRLEGVPDGGEMGGRGADLHKMHAYRDALGVRAAVAIHPGNQSVFFERGAGRSTRFSLQELLLGERLGVGLWARPPGA